MTDFGSRPRSTPIPGSAAFVADPELPGNAGAPPPPRPSEFVAGQTSAVEDANDLTDQTLSDRDRAALGLVNGEETLFEGEAPSRMVAYFDAQLQGEPTRFKEILLYPDYAFATIQDPVLPANLDRYQFRSARVGSKDPQPSVDGVESMLFSAGQINWVAVAQVAEQAPGLLEVTDGRVSHIIVNSSAFAPTHAAVVRIFVTSPRGSGYLELAPTGEILAAR